MPKLIVTVPMDIYNAVAIACGEPYADSYLSGAVVKEGRLLPRTKIAWRRLCENAGAMRALRQMKVQLVEPPIYNPVHDRLPVERRAA